MSQVTRRGLVQASLSCALLAAATAPLTLAPATVPWKPDPDGPVKMRLTSYIAQTYHQPFELVHRIVEAAFSRAPKEKISPLLVLAIVAKESSFSPTAKSWYGAVGLMQVVPRMHEELVSRIDHPDGLEHPEANIDTGTVILGGYIRSKGGDLHAALRKYSGGARQYGRRVVAYWSEFSKVAYPHRQQLT
jgi:soluble lytic murein transglycosylase-like protein